eukprot:5119244-Ditylum_brightwellii.AAC.1
MQQPTEGSTASTDNNSGEIQCTIKSTLEDSDTGTLFSQLFIDARAMIGHNECGEDEDNSDD